MSELSCDDNSKFYGPRSRAVWSDALAPRLTMRTVRPGVAASPHHRRRPRRLGGLGVWIGAAAGHTSDIRHVWISQRANHGHQKAGSTEKSNLLQSVEFTG